MNEFDSSPPDFSQQSDYIVLQISQEARIPPSISSVGLFLKNVVILLGGCLTGGQSDYASRQKYD